MYSHLVDICNDCKQKMKSENETLIDNKNRTGDVFLNQRLDEYFSQEN